MASISAGTFIEPRTATQTASLITLDFSDVGRNSGRREFALEMAQGRAVGAAKYFVEDGVPIAYVELPMKMRFALYHAAIKHGYLR